MSQQTQWKLQTEEEPKAKQLTSSDKKAVEKISMFYLILRLSRSRNSHGAAGNQRVH